MMAVKMIERFVIGVYQKLIFSIISPELTILLYSYIHFLCVHFLLILSIWDRLPRVTVVRGSSVSFWLHTRKINGALNTSSLSGKHNLIYNGIIICNN